MYSIYFIQDTQIVLNAMVRIVPFSVPVLPPGSGSGAQSQLQLEFGLPLTEVSVAPGGHWVFGVVIICTVYIYVGGNVLADRSLNESSSVLLMYTNGLRST